MYSMLQVPWSKLAMPTAPAMHSRAVATRVTTTLWLLSQHAARLPSLQMWDTSPLSSTASLKPAVRCAQHQRRLVTRPSRTQLVPC